MTNIHVIENKASAVRQYINLLQRYKKYSRDQLEKDIDIRGAVERYLYLAAQAAIDLAEAVIAYKQLRKPTSMSEAFSILEEQGLLDMELAERMIKMVGFRNAIAHDYAKIDYDKVYQVLHHHLGDVEAFVVSASSTHP